LPEKKFNPNFGYQDMASDRKMDPGCNAKQTPTVQKLEGSRAKASRVKL